MRKPVYIWSDEMLSPLGLSSEANYQALQEGQCSIFSYVHEHIGTYYASVFPKEFTPFYIGLTRLESIVAQAMERAADKAGIALSRPDLRLVLSTTKGNIDLLAVENCSIPERVNPTQMAAKLASYYNMKHTPVVVSNACVSGVQAIQYACQTLQQSELEYAIVVGVDQFSEFILSGFHSFQALSPFPCKPFDAARAGLSLGEACGVMILSTKEKENACKVTAAASSNDANHISGPSRTGDGLSTAIKRTLEQADCTAEQVDAICAHATATPYNDEMEAQAFNACNLADKPVYSLKGYFGHTLGAAGVVETIMSVYALQHQQLIASKGFEITGTTVALPVVKDTKAYSLKTILKTASGFGGSNACLLLSR